MKDLPNAPDLANEIPQHIKDKMTPPDEKSYPSPLNNVPIEAIKLQAEASASLIEAMGMFIEDLHRIQNGNSPCYGISNLDYIATSLRDQIKSLNRT